MSSSLHLDLLKDEERFSSSPVRLRVMIPMLAVLTVVAVLVAWSLIAYRGRAVVYEKSALVAEIESLQPAYNEILRLRDQEKEIQSAMNQIAYYRTSRICFGEALLHLAEYVPENVQLTDLRVPLPPPPPPPDPKKPFLGPTNLFETVSLTLAGRACGEAPTEAVNALLEALGKKPVFTNLIRFAEIPKGAFRQDTVKSPTGRESLLFEITCTCAPRRFE